MMLLRTFLAFLLVTALLSAPGLANEESNTSNDQKTEKVDQKKESKEKYQNDKKNEGKKKKEKSKKQDKPKKKDKKKAEEGKSKKDKKPKSSPDQPTPAQKPKSESKPEPKSEPKPEPKSEPKPEPKSEPKPEPKSEPKPEPKSEPKPEPKSESKPEPKSESKPEPKSEPKPEPKPQPKPDPRKIAITDLSEVDADFALQGEYFGKIRLPNGVLEDVGIQVVARGDGNFIGRQLRGGLPGNGSRNDAKLELTGQREGRRALLFHGDYRVSVEDNKANIVNSNGDTLGILSKVDRQSKFLGLKPTPNAVVLFDGTSTEHFIDGKIDENGNLQFGTVTKRPVGDFRLHIEFRLPYMPYATGQARSNSGLYIQERYEVQILDSFGLDPQFNDCGSLYRTKIPDINMSFPPLSWQTYDVFFTAARFDSEGNKIAPARISLVHNGILVQDNYEIPNKTGAGKQEGPTPGVIKLQDHGNPVVFRNIWIEYLNEPATIAEELPTPAN